MQMYGNFEKRPLQECIGWVGVIFHDPCSRLSQSFLGIQKAAEMFDELFHYIRFPQAFQHGKSQDKKAIAALEV